MKAKDLIIDDWVMITEPDDFHGFIGQAKIINGITEYITISIPDMHSTDVLSDDLQPIPLTNKILEKNGFTMTKDQYRDDEYYLLGKNEYNVKVYWHKGTILLIEDEYEPTTYAYAYDCEYVHELQHAFKFFNINKRIVL